MSLRRKPNCDALDQEKAAILWLFNGFAAACGTPKTAGESDQFFLSRLSYAFKKFDVDLMRILMKGTHLYPKHYDHWTDLEFTDGPEPDDFRIENILASHVSWHR